MAWQCSGASNVELVDNLYNAGLIKREQVRDAMKKVDRAHYCPDSTVAYEDSPQSIGYRATISAPHMHASAAEALLPSITQESKGAASISPAAVHILDIGSGSGYLTAVLAELAKATAAGGENAEGIKVVALEHIPALRDLGEANMRKSDRGVEMLESGLVDFVVGDGREGWILPGGEDEDICTNVKISARSRDTIHVGAAAVTLHQPLVRQLKRPGRLFIPVEDENGRGQWIWIVDKDAHGNVTKKKTEGVRYVPLTDAPK
ncbi:protein-L-isoaspartate O-methyltransferase [Phlyctema vagabunda]|uniref:protein-L-isoaspartate(D-aspartate) O-methyltransferase n=1 Tax=Phlyctema vagabunda TaxID=108571 RepID=A0ABR4PSA2_9HELO